MRSPVSFCVLRVPDMATRRVFGSAAEYLAIFHVNILLVQFARELFSGHFLVLRFFNAKHSYSSSLTL
jgi:hypothetical protein